MPPSRQPVFARERQATPYGFVQSSQSSQAPGYGRYGDLSAPPPPHSLAPVAMSGNTGSYNSVSATGTQRAQTVLVREKPSLKWGIMIAMSGALLGGVLGLGMDAKRQQARADSAQASMVAAGAPQQAPLAAPVAPPVVAPAVAVAPPVAVAVAPVAPPVVAPVVLPPVQQPIVVPKDPVVVKPAGHKSSGRVAVRVKPQPSEKPEKAEKAEKAEPEPKPEPKPVKGNAATSEAMKILEAANKDTSNTLGGGR